MVSKRLKALLFIAAFCLPAAAHAACSSPTASAGAMNYDSSGNQLKWCDGTTWQFFGATLLGSCANPGQLFYNSGTHRYVYCGGASSWQTSAGNGTAGGCTSPTAVEGAIEFTGGVFKFCGGTNWVNM